MSALGPRRFGCLRRWLVSLFYALDRLTWYRLRLGLRIEAEWIRALEGEGSKDVMMYFWATPLIILNLRRLNHSEEIAGKRMMMPSCEKSLNLAKRDLDRYYHSSSVLAITHQVLRMSSNLQKTVNYLIKLLVTSIWELVSRSIRVTSDWIWHGKVYNVCEKPWLLL